MRCAVRFAFIAISSVVLPIRGRGQVQIPKASDGYAITKSDVSQAAPAGYEGRTENSTQTAVGNTPATSGKRYVTHFALGNKIKTCPQADGSSEGEGVFSIGIDYTDAQASGASTLHIDMRATAKYKGKVGDNAFMDGPVNADIDFTYRQSGSMRGPNGAIATSPPSDVAQHITIPFTVAPGMAAPGIGAFAGGDPTRGHYGQALSVGTALVYWAGIYFSIAETRWLQPGTCVQVAFDPPSNSRQPVPGSDIKVNAEIKTKGAAGVKGKFDHARARAGGGGVTPGGGATDVGAPLKFTYTAPSQRADHAGFRVDATSRAGVAEGEWQTGLGTDWSGQIFASRVTDAGSGSVELQDWSDYEAMRMTIDVQNGIGTATGYGEVNHTGVNRRRALRGGSIVLIFDQSANNAGTVEGTTPASVGVTLNQASGTYSLGVGLEGVIVGTQHSETCIREKCTEFDRPLPVTGLLSPMGGALVDLNHVSGSRTTVTPHVGRSGNGTATYTLMWDLARKGTTQ
jgi:hypothetical protein